ncbi:chloramphenicol phosphotransferase [Nocardia sp. NPDC051911]|uniref:chloramphenicol phosphotransferase CPT family protein n=1 Tax=Nocardia sp. NPDC051911 TaxID=3154648 RepID=UPI00341979E3
MRSVEPPSRVIFLNGTSSSGKTTLARAIQDESDIPFVYWGIDTLFQLIPPNWGGGRDSPLSREGFWYDRGRDADGSPMVVIRYGEVGRRMLRSACAAAAAFAHGGDHLVIDEMLLSADLLPIWMAALAGLDVQLVRVTCPLAVAERREQARGRDVKKGLARGHFHLVHEHGATYDTTVDTSTGAPAELARTVLRRQQFAGKATSS